MAKDKRQRKDEKAKTCTSNIIQHTKNGAAPTEFNQITRWYQVISDIVR